jgi:hypothetical protein
MARKVIVETGYTFTPSTKTIVIPRVIPRERLILITNVTTNQVIYNFSDSNLKATSYTISGSADTTTLVLNFDTTGMSSNDKLQMIVDDYAESIYPSEVLMDPVTKLRVSTPQALIDTDFEYGTQPTKWETISMQENRPTAFYDSTIPVTSVTNISGTGTRTVTVTLTNTTGIAVGTPVFIQDTTNPIADGWQLVETVTLNTNFTYVARANVTNGTMFDASKTYVFIGEFFTLSAIPVSATGGAAFTTGSTTLTCTTTNAHGLSVGNGIFIRNTTAATSNPPNGAFFVKTIPTSNTFTFDVDVAPVGQVTATGGTQNLYGRPYSTSIHRPYDGGVSFSTGNPYHSNQLIRQTRRYFRYQSGKGIQFSTGTNLKAALTIDNMTSSGTTVTVTTKFPHNLGALTSGIGTNATVVVSGADQSAYNGTFPIASVPSDTTFTYTAGSIPAASPATGFPITVSPGTWYGSRVRVGMFDEQNGFFFEYDGQTLYAVRRTSTDQLSGGVSVTNGSPVITGTATKFSSELKPGDYVTIRGMSYIVLSITSNTNMIVAPEYRGTTITSGKVIITKRFQQKIAQSSWNIDKCDGNGLSGYNIDLTKMQMLYIDYSWYGAGAIRFGFKNQRGEVVYAHRIPNANYRTEAFMRSGNLPARYECNTIAPITYLTATLTSGVTASMSVNDTSEFPTSGTVVVRASGNTGAAVEYINYTGKTATTLTGLTRNVTNLTGPGGLTGGGGTASATTFTFSATAPISVELHSPQTSVTVGHWGSSVIMDGRFDDDKSFVFTAGMNTSLSIASGATNALISLRLAPTVDSGQIGLLGQRELINRMQLTLREVGAVASANMRISLILNGRVSAGTFTAAGGSSLCQVCLHTATTTVTGGETIYSFFVPNGVIAKDLNLVRDLANSILGGGTSSAVPTTAANLYPDGPDVVTIVATNVATNAQTINARISWTEAQA